MRARFVSAVDLDKGGLIVTQPPATARAAVSETEAETMFEATDAVQGRFAFTILGLGIVTVAPRVERTTPSSTTTTTAPPPPSTVPSTTAPPPPPRPRPTTTTAPPPPPTTTTTTTVPPTTTVASTATTAAAFAPATRRRPVTLMATPATNETPVTTQTPSGPSTGAPSPSALPTYHQHLAWVGIAWGGRETCPGSTTTTQPASTVATTYVAVIIDATTGHRVLAYRSGGTSPCTGTTRPPAVTAPNELVSVPWEVVGPSSTAVEIHVPPCGQYYGWTQIQVAGGGVADQVVVSDPFDPQCGTAVSLSKTVDQVVPLGSGQGLVGHAPVGPIQALQTLPSS
jgi:hypothetical protein